MANSTSGKSGNVPHDPEDSPEETIATSIEYDLDQNLRYYEGGDWSKRIAHLTPVGAARLARFMDRLIGGLKALDEASGDHFRSWLDDAWEETGPNHYEWNES